MRCASVLIVLLAVLSSSGSAQEPDRCGSVAGADTANPAILFVATPFGDVLRRPTSPVTEADRVTVRVPVARALARRISVRRTSATRNITEVRILGDAARGDDSFSSTGLLHPLLSEPDCSVEVVLSDFAPGTGKVEIALTMTEGNEIKNAVLGGFEFPVQPLYAGMLSLGPIVSRLESREFRVATNLAGESFISVDRAGDRRVLYVLLFTPFVWGKRPASPDGDGLALRKRINPSFGIVLNEIVTNALIGVSVDLPVGAVVTVGYHAGRVRELDPRSGLEPGSPFPSDGTIPERERWKGDRFVGLTADLRVALRVLGIAGSTTGQ